MMQGDILITMVVLVIMAVSAVCVGILAVWILTEIVDLIKQRKKRCRQVINS